ncbi:MAG: hypothetical protein V4760_09870 [Bdellovibrionota bacterium]
MATTEGVNSPEPATHPLYDELLKCLAVLYPETAREIDLRKAVSPLIVSSQPVRLPRDLAKQAREIVAAFFALRGEPERSGRLSELDPAVPVPGNSSILMSYDFHVDPEGRLRLIEINTNASTSLVVDALMETKKSAREFSRDFRSEIVECFESEHDVARPGHKLKTVAIVDEHPENQRLFVEFKMYEELFRRHGWNVSIEDTSRLRVEGDRLVGTHGPIDLVYNRDTDFYLESSRVSALREATDRNLACITPHPHEYRLLADKERLFELCQPGVLEASALSASQKEAIRKTLIPSITIDPSVDKEKLWSDRKKWFFKPRRSFGSKAVYRGSSISRNAFETVTGSNYVAQEYVPATTLGEFKFDLRFFVYRDRIQLALARLYQGQLTNSHTPGGGIAPIEWID